MKTFFVDLHIHIGRAANGQAVKITASKELTFTNIVQEAANRKGLNMIGIADMHSPSVLAEVDILIKNRMVRELNAGGLIYNDTTIILGSEVEVRFEECGRAAHFLVFLENLILMKEFSFWLAAKLKNINLSSQRLYTSFDELQAFVKKLNGIIIPAHVFTPFKSIYGSCTNKMKELFNPELIPAVELGLSSDSDMADCIKELNTKTFLTNSDAHSLAKIAREYQEIIMEACNFQELKKALFRIDGRKVFKNYGLNPKLGKYHFTRCKSCGEYIKENQCKACPKCNGIKLIKGVFNRLHEIADYKLPKHPEHRPPYIHQVPLEFIPGLGPKKIELLLQHYQTEMNILHYAPFDEIKELVGEKIAILIIKNREGRTIFLEGGGGKYGKVLHVDLKK